MLMRLNIFAKVIIMVILLLIPILLLYSLSNRVSVSVLEQEIQSLKQKDMAYLAHEFNSSIENLSTMAFLLSEDIHIQGLQHLYLEDNAYERNEEKSRILERLRLLNVAERWDTQYSIIAPELGEIVSTNPRSTYDPVELQRILTPSWKYKEMTIDKHSQQRFVRHIVKPASRIVNPQQAGIIVEVSFPREYLIKELDNFKLGGKGDPFLYSSEDGMIMNRTADTEMMKELSVQMAGLTPVSFDRSRVILGGKQYLVHVMPIESLGWHLVDYVPLQEMLQPITQSRNLFYGSVGLLLVMGILASYLLYRHVQRPIHQLIRGVQKLRAGDYSVRIKARPHNEFGFLFERFNAMAGDIDQLIHNVYAEQIRTREANLKQLQSQINPHFLYNCFALIRSMTRLGKRESVMDLAMHLSKYYRYTTRVEKSAAPLREELQLIESYLEIQAMQLAHLTYEIRVPESMLDLEVPRLLLQPLAENAIVHGLERLEGDGRLEISGEQRDGYYVLEVTDNGAGMTEEQLSRLRLDLTQPPNEQTGCALWNIRQRLTLQFGEAAALSFRRRTEGGLTVQIRWPEAATDEGADYN
ncbi:sensor histidine kinase [Paenibacillus daejeonensis]|uniref:sensor histidine kinase n=1 Tax=Paenibacillus daejeonensis TaxID=135193 RepID=UPI00037C1864|nr:histidine kinase [Paenibacillus daejeonensis]